MTESDAESLGQGLIYEDFLPLQWRASDEQDVASEAARLNENNEEVLRFIGILDEYPSDIGDDREPLSQELVRVEAKLNLLLGLVGQLMMVHFPQPPLRPVKLNARGVEWTAETGPRVGDVGKVEIYLNRRCPRPLILSSRVEDVEAVDHGFRFVVQFSAMSESVHERLEKIIFTHHRRSIAMARRKSSPETNSDS